MEDPTVDSNNRDRGLCSATYGTRLAYANCHFLNQFFIEKIKLQKMNPHIRLKKPLISSSTKVYDEVYVQRFFEESLCIT